MFNAASAAAVIKIEVAVTTAVIKIINIRLINLCRVCEAVDKEKQLSSIFYCVRLFVCVRLIVSLPSLCHKAVKHHKEEKDQHKVSLQYVLTPTKCPPNDLRQMCQRLP